LSLIARQDHEGQTALHALLLKNKEQCWRCDCKQFLNTLLICNDRSLSEALVKQDSASKTVLHLAIQLRQLDQLQQILSVCQRLAVLDSVMSIADSEGQTITTLVRCMGGESLKAIVQPYCAQVRHQNSTDIMQHAGDCILLSYHGYCRVAISRTAC
jgi:hypothetical protein